MGCRHPANRAEDRQKHGAPCANGSIFFGKLDTNIDGRLNKAEFANYHCM